MKILAIHGINASGTPDEIAARWVNAIDRNAYAMFSLSLLYWGDCQHTNKGTLSTLYGGHAPSHIQPRDHTTLGRARGLLRWLTSPLTREIMRRVAEDVYIYFYLPGVRSLLMRRLDEAMHDERPDIVIAHSMGSVIAMDYLGHAGSVMPQSVITIGSPLGNPWIIDALNVAQFPPALRRWLNVAGDFDAVTWPDPHFSGHYPDKDENLHIRDVMIASPRNSKGKIEPHSLEGYLSAEPVIAEIFRTSVEVRS